MLAVQGKFREAIGNLHILLHADPDALPSRFLLAAIYAKAGNKNMALKNFRMVYDKIGKSAFSLPVPAEFKELTEYPEVRDLLPSQDDTEKRK